VAAKVPPPELLEEVFELNMALEELRDGDESARPRLIDAQERFLEMRKEIDTGLDELFGAYDNSKNPPLLSRSGVRSTVGGMFPL